MERKFTEKFHKSYILSLVIFIIFLFAIAQILFPENYSIFHNTISDQGSILENPIGHKIWNRGMIILGILFVPHFIKQFHLLKSLSVIPSMISTIMGIISSIAMSFVGIFPKEIKGPHFAFAGISFGGIFFCANINLIIVIKDFISWKKKFPNHRNRKILNFYVLMTITALVNTVFMIFVIKSKIEDDIVPFWEWNYFFTVVLWILSSLLYYPLKKKSE